MIISVAIVGVASSACRGSAPPDVPRSTPSPPPTARSTPFAPPSPDPSPDRPNLTFRDALDSALTYLVTVAVPGNTVDGIESVTYVETTVGSADRLLGVSSARLAVPGLTAPPDSVAAWLFVEYGQFGSVSEHGSFHGREGTLWVLAPQGFPAEGGSAAGRLDLALLGQPVAISRGGVPQIDRARVPEDQIVHTTAEAIGAVARLLAHMDATVRSITYTATTAQRAASLTGISAAGLPAGTPAWVFDANGRFLLTCGGDFRFSTTVIRLLVVAGNAAPYLLTTSSVLFPTPTPMPALADFGALLPIQTGAWPAIDRFRASASQFATTATALAGAMDYPGCP